MTLAQAIERKAIILDTWKNYGKYWNWKKIGPGVNLPIRGRAGIVSRDIDLEAPLDDDRLRFAVHFEVHCGQRAYVIRCEGVIVESGFCDE